ACGGEHVGDRGTGMAHRPHPGEHRGEPARCRGRLTGRIPPGMTSTILSAQVFLDAIELTECEPEVFDQAFTAIPQYVPWPKAYGGDMVAQGSLSLMESVGTDRTLHSTHSYFLRPVDIHQPVRYEVEHL